MKRWIGINILFVIFVILSFFDIHHVTEWKRWAFIFAIIAIICFMVNWNMFFVFREIRNGRNKKIKKKLVLASRKLMKVHHYIGFFAFGFIFLHGGMMLSNYVNHMNIKLLSGILAFIFLICLLISGWYRRQKANKKRRRMHIVFAGLFLLGTILHLLL